MILEFVVEEMYHILFHLGLSNPKLVWKLLAVSFSPCKYYSDMLCLGNFIIGFYQSTSCG